MITRTITAYRNAYSGLSADTWLLAVVMLINRSGTMVMPFMTLYLTSGPMGYTIGQAGFVYGLFGAGAFTGAWLGGRLTDRIGFYPVQLMTLAGGGVLFMVLGQMTSFGSICLFSFLLSFVNEAFRPANSTAVAFYSSEANRTRSYSLNRLSVNLGWAIGSAVGGVLAKYNYHLLFWVDGCTNLLAAGLMFFFVKPVNYKPVRHKKQDQFRGESAWKDRTYLWFILLATLFGTCFFQLFTNLSVFYKLRLHFSEPFIGSLMAVNGLIIVLIEMVIVYRLEGRRRSTVYITFGTFLLAMAYCLLSVLTVTHIIAFALIVIVTFAEMMAMPFMNSYWIARSKPHNRGQYAALYTMAWSAAQTFGPMTGAQVAEHGGFNTLWICVAVLGFITTFGFHRLHRFTGRKEAFRAADLESPGSTELLAATEDPMQL
jgi:predicted MFS family arabinose efflux permease